MTAEAVAQVWRRSRRKGSELLLMLAIADYAHDDLTGAYPSVELLRQKTRLSERNVWLLLKKLEGAGEIVIRPKAGPNGATILDIVLEETPVFDWRRGSAKFALRGVQTLHSESEKPVQRLHSESAKFAPEECNPVQGRVQSSAKTLKELRTDIEPKGEDTSSRRNGEDEVASSVFRTFCEITKSDISSLPAATVAAQEHVAAGLLADYSRSDIEGCMRWLQSWRKRRWTMETVRDTIVDWTTTGRPANGNPEPAARAPTPSALEGSKYRGDAYLNVRGKAT